MSQTLFQIGNFTLSSGIQTNWRINAEYLTRSDIGTIAAVLAEGVGDFNVIESIPKGGDRLAAAMRAYITPRTHRPESILICDDVLTSGASMERQRAGRQNVVGAVIFARGPIPEYVTAMFITQAAHDVAWHGPIDQKAIETDR